MRTFAFLACLLVSLSTTAADRPPVWQGKGADNQTITFDPAHMQRPAILLFWATWCPYCKALMPHLQTVLDVAGKDKLDVYAIDIKDDGDPVAELRARKQTFALVRDGDPIAAQYGVKGTPSLFLVDKNGDVVYQRLGGDTPDKVEAELRRKLALPASVPAH